MKNIIQQERVSLKILLHHCFGLPSLAISLFFKLLEDGPADTKKLAEEFNRDESTIYRYLQPLLDNKLIERIIIRKDVGRPKYIYKAIDKELLGKRIIEISEQCHKKIIEFVENVLLNKENEKQHGK